MVLNPIFEYLPVENMVFKNQQLYYQAINDSTRHSDSGFFVEFMLHEILMTLKSRQNTLSKTTNNETVNETVNDIVKLIKENPKITIAHIAKKLKKSRSTITRLIKKLQEEQVISRIGADKTGHWEIIPFHIIT